MLQSPYPEFSTLLGEEEEWGVYGGGRGKAHDLTSGQYDTPLKAVFLGSGWYVEWRMILLAATVTASWRIGRGRGRTLAHDSAGDHGDSLR